jgi:uncharacterized membrane protein YcjF (UPF0283 family)
MIWTILLLFGGPVVPTLLLLNIPIRGQRSGKRFWIAALILIALSLIALAGSWIGNALCTGELCGLGYLLYGGVAALVLLLAAFIVAVISKFIHHPTAKKETWKRS